MGDRQDKKGKWRGRSLLLLTFAGMLAAAAAQQGLSEACSSFSAPRVVIGCWQILERHADENQAVKTLKAYADAGFTTFDTADICETVCFRRLLRKCHLSPPNHA